MEARIPRPTRALRAAVYYGGALGDTSKMAVGAEDDLAVTAPAAPLPHPSPATVPPRARLLLPQPWLQTLNGTACLMKKEGVYPPWSLPRPPYPPLCQVRRLEGGRRCRSAPSPGRLRWWWLVVVVAPCVALMCKAPLLWFTDRAV